MKASLVTWGLALCIGCAAPSPAAPGFQELALPGYEEFRDEARRAASWNDWLKYVPDSDECIRVSWEMLDAMSRNLSCEHDKDCVIRWMWPPVGPECSVTTKKWASYRNPESRALNERARRACGTEDWSCRVLCKARCKDKRCVVDPPQPFPPDGAEQCIE